MGAAVTLLKKRKSHKPASHAHPLQASSSAPVLTDTRRGVPPHAASSASCPTHVHQADAIPTALCGQPPVSDAQLAATVPHPVPPESPRGAWRAATAKRRANAVAAPTRFYPYCSGIVDGEENLMHSRSLCNLRRQKKVFPSSFRIFVDNWHKEAPPAATAPARPAVPPPPARATCRDAPYASAVDSVYGLRRYLALMPDVETSAGTTVARAPDSPPTRSRAAARATAASHYGSGGYSYGYFFDFPPSSVRNVSARAVEDLHDSGDEPGYSRLLFEGDATLLHVRDGESLDGGEAPSVFRRAVFAPVPDSVAADAAYGSAGDGSGTDYSELSRRHTLGVLMPVGHSQVVGEGWEVATWIGPASPNDSFHAAPSSRGWAVQTVMSQARAVGRSSCSVWEDEEDADVGELPHVGARPPADKPRRTRAAPPQRGPPRYFNTPVKDFHLSQRGAGQERHGNPVFISNHVNPAPYSPPSRAPQPWPLCSPEDVRVRRDLPPRPPLPKRFFEDALDDARPVTSPDWAALSNRDQAEAAVSFTSRAQQQQQQQQQQQRLAHGNQLHSPRNVWAR